MFKDEFAERHAKRVANKQREKQHKEELMYVNSKRKKRSERSEERFRMPKGIEE